MIKLSLCMIVKDEESVLARCLDSVKDYVDEIVIADTGSADLTKEIARRYTDRVYDFPWRDDFAAARNFALSKISGDYWLWLDADDFLPPENANTLAALKATLETQSPDIVMCPYHTSFDENGAPLTTFYRERILKTSARFQWEGRVHECVTPRGRAIKSNFSVFHLSSDKPRGARNLHIYQKWAAEEQLGSRDLFYYGRELFYNRLFTEAEAVLLSMLRGEGWNVNQIEACKILALCYKEQGKAEEAKKALLQCFLYGLPRADACCKLAKLFQNENKLQEAVYWYETARACRDHSDEGDFESPECRTYIPLMELTCCYYALGQTQKALSLHKETERLFPNRPAVQFNRSFFEREGLL